MIIRLHSIFTRHEDKVKSGVDILSAAVFNDIKMKFEEKLERQLSIFIHIPTLDEFFVSDKRFTDAAGAPRLWFDLILDAPEVNHETVKNMLDNPEIETPETKIIEEFVSCVENIIPPCILASNISNPGVMSNIGGGIDIGDIYLMSTNQLSNLLLEKLIYARTLGWPAEISVTYYEAIAWVSSVLGMQRSVAADSISRALAANSHIATSNFQA